MTFACPSGRGWMRHACLALGVWALAGASRAEAPPREMAFAIAAQPLDQALAQYSLDSGLTVLVDSALTAGRHAPAVVGTYTPGDALRKLLAGSPLAIRYASAHSFTLVAAPREPAAYRALWDELRQDSVNAELADQLVILARINQAKYGAVSKLYAGVRLLVVILGALLLTMAAAAVL